MFFLLSIHFSKIYQITLKFSKPFVLQNVCFHFLYQAKEKVIYLLSLWVENKNFTFI